MNARTRTVQATQNIRIHKYSAIVASAAAIAKGSQKAVYGDVPAGVNGAGFLGFSLDHFIEPGGLYHVAQGTAPTAVTGTTPTSYSLADKNLTVAYEGECFAIAAGVVAEGDLLAIADVYGRVDSLGNLSLTTPGTIANVVAKALTPSAQANDFIRVRILDAALLQ